MTTDLILNEINNDKKFIEVQISRFENLEENLKSIEKTYKRIADANIDLITK